MEAFAKFGSDLDKSTQQLLTRGARMVEVLKQDQYSPMSVERQIAILFAGSNGYLDDINLENIKSFEIGLLDYLELNAKVQLDEIHKTGKLGDELVNSLKQSIENFKKGFSV